MLFDEVKQVTHKKLLRKGMLHDDEKTVFGDHCYFRDTFALNQYHYKNCASVDQKD